MMDKLDRRMVMGMAAALPLGVAMPARAADCPVESEADRRLRTDFAWTERYADDNRALIASNAVTGIVFMGDSITQGWRDKRPGFFIPGRVGRGIGGQTTPQMLLRMMPDVIALRPRAVHIMGGTNDIAGNTGPMTLTQSQDTIAAMATLARANGVRVMLASIPPAAHYPWRPGLDTRTPIAALNGWLRDYAAHTGLDWIDYHAVLDDGTGAMKPGLSYDDVHPTEAGYDAMADLLAPRLAALDL
jgi:lysophospholipase L1-like esterase